MRLIDWAARLDTNAKSTSQQYCCQLCSPSSVETYMVCCLQPQPCNIMQPSKKGYGEEPGRKALKSISLCWLMFEIHCHCVVAAKTNSLNIIPLKSEWDVEYSHHICTIYIRLYIWKYVLSYVLCAVTLITLIVLCGPTEATNVMYFSALLSRDSWEHPSDVVVWTLQMNQLHFGQVCSRRMLLFLQLCQPCVELFGALAF